MFSVPLIKVISLVSKPLCLGLVGTCEGHHCQRTESAVKRCKQTKLNLHRQKDYYSSKLGGMDAQITAIRSRRFNVNR